MPCTPEITANMALVPVKDENMQKKFVLVTSILTCQFYLGWKLKQMVIILSVQGIPLAQTKPTPEMENLLVCPQIPWLTYIMTAITILGAVIYLYKLWKRLALWTGPRISKSCDIYLTVQHGPYYVPIKLTTVAGYPNQISCVNALELDQLQNQEGILWDTLRIDWKEIKIRREDDTIALPHTLQISFPYNIRLRKSLKAEDCTPEIFIKQSHNWFSLQPNDN